VAELTIVNQANVATVTPGGVGALHRHFHQHRHGGLQRGHGGHPGLGCVR
jgi:hypothetical protein